MEIEVGSWREGSIIFTQKPLILPSVSVIIPVLNGARFLRRAVASAVAQTHPVLEIIVVDNGSTDGTGEILTELATSHPTLIATSCRKPGAAAARNHGLKLAQGTWIQFLDVDDELFPTKVEQQLSATDQHTQWVIGGYRNQYATGQAADNLPHPDPWKGLVFRYRIGCTHANLFRRDTLQRIGGWNETLPDNEDPELHFDLLRAKTPYVIVPEALCTYHHREDGQLSGRDPVGGNARRLALLERINHYLRAEKRTYWEANQSYFQGAVLRALRVYATHDLGAAAGAYDRIFKQGWKEQPALVAPWMLRAYRFLGFRRTEYLRLLVRAWLPATIKDRLKHSGE